MAESLDFYFDFSSPYGYFASLRIDALAAKYNRSVRWHPVLLGAVFKTIGTAPLMDVPLKGDYSRRDMLRTARLHGYEINMPTQFPIATLAPSRAFCWLNKQDPVRAKSLAAALYRAYFVQGRDISNATVTLDVAVEAGIDRAQLEAGLGDPAVKEALKIEVDEAMKRGVFGSPFFIVDGEPFWGHDRLEQLERWLNTGGW